MHAKNRALVMVRGGLVGYCLLPCASGVRMIRGAQVGKNRAFDSGLRWQLTAIWGLGRERRYWVCLGQGGRRHA